MTPEQFDSLKHLRFDSAYQENPNLPWKCILDGVVISAEDMRVFAQMGYVELQPPTGAYGLDSGLMAFLTASGELIACDGIRYVEVVEEYRRDVKRLSNKDLLADTLQLAGGDDWDGAMTREGECRYDFLYDELQLRLKDWLEKDN